MITKMKKLTFLVFHKDYKEFLRDLRQLGVAHVVEKQAGALSENSELNTCIETNKRYVDNIKKLMKFKEDHNIEVVEKIDTGANALEYLDQIEQWFAGYDDALQRKSFITKELENIEPWGAFDLKTMQKLKQANTFIHFHLASEAMFDELWREEYHAIKINQRGSTVYFVTVTETDAPPDINAEHVHEFEHSYESLQLILKNIDEEMFNINTSLKQMVSDHLNTLIYNEKETKDQIAWEKVLLNSEHTAGEKVIFLESYIPEDKETETVNALKNKNIYFEVTTPTLDEKPPILLKNRKFAGAFEMISNIYDRPNYHAFDLTLLWAPFYIIFFGLCVGDCGYGLLYLLISFLLRKSKENFLKSVSTLMLWLGIGTVICGLFGGTFFGIDLSDQNWHWIEKFKGYIINNEQAFYLALILGAIQIIYALIIKAISDWIRFGFVKSLDTFGWLITLCGCGTLMLLENYNMLSPETQTLYYYVVLGAGFFLMFFFNNPEKGLIGVPLSIGVGVWNLFNRITGLLGDLLSYIRLFALGIAGAVLGLVFNKLSFDFAPDIIIVKQLVVITILVVGHAVNIFLATLGGFVHPMRLTFVEFYKNAGFEGGGKEYHPFRKNAN